MLRRKVFTGTGEMFRLTNEAGLKEPEYDLEEGVKLTIWRPAFVTEQATDHVTDHVTDQATDQATDQVNELIKRLVIVLSGEMCRKEIKE